MRLCTVIETGGVSTGRRGTYDGQLWHERKEKGGKVDREEPRIVVSVVRRKKEAFFVAGGAKKSQEEGSREQLLAAAEETREDSQANGN